MLHASSQVPFNIREATDGALCKRMSKLSAVEQKQHRKNHAAEARRARAVRGDRRFQTARDNGVLDTDLIRSCGANNSTTNSQVNRSNPSEEGASEKASHSEKIVSESMAAGEALADDLAANDSATSQLRQLQVRLQQQQQLRQAEHRLRSSFDLQTIQGTAVVEAATLLQAQQAVLMSYSAQAQAWTLETQYCQNQVIAWQPRYPLIQDEFPDLARQLFQGETLHIFKEQPLPTIETRQWLACQPGSWLVLPLLTSSMPVSAGAQSTEAPREVAREIAKETARDVDQTADQESSRAEHWGILALALSPDEQWSVEDIACATGFASELSAVISQAQHYQSLLSANVALQKLALSDGLTGLANRRRFDEHLSDEWQRLARDRQPLSLILCDLDHFKQYNDSFGHPAGDRCLVKVSDALKSGPRRPADLVARYGGEEFAIILPNTDTKGAWRIAQKLHNSIRALKIAHTANEDKPYVTVTMGVSTIIPGHDTTAQVLLQAADLALYHAKKQGRDRTYVHAHYNTVSEESQQATADSSQLGESSPAMAPIEDS